LPLLVSLNGIAYGQSLIQDSTTQDTCICYTDRMDINCLDCLINQPYKDSSIVSLKGITSEQGKVIDILKYNLSEEKKGRKKTAIRSGLIGGIMGFIIGLLL
jgi:hypothetical protein